MLLFRYDILSSFSGMCSVWDMESQIPTTTNWLPKVEIYKSKNPCPLRRWGKSDNQGKLAGLRTRDDTLPALKYVSFRPLHNLID